MKNARQILQIFLLFVPHLLHSESTPESHGKIQQLLVVGILNKHQLAHIESRPPFSQTCRDFKK